ncbi:MAG: D-alanine--D-alanine ligase [Pseudomonadales bacterium]|jgi:D-alanine-D-alanine ligase|nr:D-alanine--D-alanine ligase [Pseudomonadales bacterium]
MSDAVNPQVFGKVAVVMGGRSSEREVSLQSGAAVLQGLRNQGVNAIGIDAGADLLDVLRREQIERVFIALHGTDGEDGKLQGALEWMGLPYTGSGVLASALAMDKVRTKLVWQQLGISTPPFVKLTPELGPQAVLDQLGPCFIKPVNEGSSIGIGSANNAEQFRTIWNEASRFDQEVMAERWIEGREYTVAILGEQVLPIIELRSTHAFYDYAAKYLADDTRYLCPCDLDPEATHELQSLALRAYQAVGCRSWGRVDAMRDEQGRFWLLEVNTVPGMTSHSLVPMAAQAAGIDFDSLVLRILRSSLREENTHE